MHYLIEKTCQTQQLLQEVKVLFAFGVFDRVALLIHKSLRPHNLKGIMNRVQLWLRRPMRAKVGVGKGKVLPVVDCEVHVVQCVVGGTVNKLFRPVARDHVAVVNEDGPNLDTNEEDQV